MAGWIKLHRKMTEWEWYDNVNTKVLFIHLLLMANHKPKKWAGKMVGRGQLVTGRHKLAKQLGMGEQKVRTAFSNLRDTGEITIKATNRFTVITICNYEEYQIDDSEANQQPNQQLTSNLTNKQPTNNQQITTNKNAKKGKKVKKKEEILNLTGTQAPVPQKVGKGTATWSSYSSAFFQRYNTEPVRNATTNSLCARLVDRLGADIAPDVAGYYVGLNTSWYIQKGHSLQQLLADAEKIAMEWKTGRATTLQDAREADRIQGVGNSWNRTIEKHGE